MRRKSLAGQSIVVSMLLLAVLFVLPTATIVPAREELFARETPVDEREWEPFVSGMMDREVLLKVLDGGEVKEMDLGTYLVGVVRAEMPASSRCTLALRLVPQRSLFRKRKLTLKRMSLRKSGRHALTVLPTI